MKLFEQFKNLKRMIGQTKFVKCYELDLSPERYKIILTKKYANRYTVIRCEDDCIYWQQIPRFFNWGGKAQGKIFPIYKFMRDNNCNTIFVIKGKPNGITGLDDGIFRCANNFSKQHLNVMTYNRFKKL